eukprot:c27812_g3_i1 orf=121-420(+)
MGSLIIGRGSSKAVILKRFALRFFLLSTLIQDQLTHVSFQSLLLMVHTFCILCCQVFSGTSSISNGLCCFCIEIHSCSKKNALLQWHEGWKFLEHVRRT